MTKPQGKTLFVTVGSTLFPVLTGEILSQTVRDTLPQSGVSKLVIQYGRAELSISRLPDLNLDVKTGEGSCHSGSGLEIEVMRYTDRFNELVKDSDAVISHAGSGSILAVLRCSPTKPLLVIPNTTLMDNHQVQLAEGLGEQGYLLVSSPEGLIEAIPKLLGEEGKGLRPFPGLQQGTFSGIVDELAGFGKA